MHELAAASCTAHTQSMLIHACCACQVHLHAACPAEHGRVGLALRCMQRNGALLLVHASCAYHLRQSPAVSVTVCFCNECKEVKHCSRTAAGRCGLCLSVVLSKFSKAQQYQSQPEFAELPAAKHCRMIVAGPCMMCLSAALSCTMLSKAWQCQSEIAVEAKQSSIAAEMLLVHACSACHVEQTWP